MLESLAPARRRLVLGVAAAAVLLAVVVVVVIVVRRPASVTPAPQDRPGPVLLVPGYGGSTTGLQVMADVLTQGGRDVQVVAPTGSGTRDLRAQAADLGRAVDRALADSGAPSVDLVGYSAGGVVIRIYVADGGGSKVRRAVSLGAPQHGTDLAALAGSLGSTACPTACQQLDPDSELLRGLNADDESPPGPAWFATWTTDDKTVVPPSSGFLQGAVDFSLQSLCPGLVVAHKDLPSNVVAIAVVEAVLDRSVPAGPPASVCSVRDSG